ncbi:MAG: zinc-dependent peptidase [Methylococcales bacterium]|nr:zinc-dependent peptidase [Methylococcales bacterium]MBT7442364.1 zinc-dependent peptidase [Methylococcales bacterium]
MNVFYLSLLLIITLIVVWRYLKAKRLKKIRQALSSAELTPEDREILERNVPIYHLLPDHLKTELIGSIYIFANEKNFVGCDGLEITREIIITIAAQACILLLNKKTNYYPSLKTIYVYPSAFVSKQAESNGAVQSSKISVRTGESWFRGPVVLSWDDSAKGAFNHNDGKNVVFHEFAHQLDQEDNRMDGAPALGEKSQYNSWANVLSCEYDALQKRMHRSKGRRSLIDYYGASSPVEFFAVITEVFFERPKKMKKNHPELYEELVGYYKVDPIVWFTKK